MEQFKWSPKFEVGNTAIDIQHRLFLELIGRLINHKTTGSPPALIASLLAELLKLSEFHFLSEENLMLESQYPHLLKHRKEHERVLSELRKRITSIEYDNIDFDSLAHFLSDWFTRHTVTEDAKLAWFLKTAEK